MNRSSCQNLKVSRPFIMVEKIQIFGGSTFEDNYSKRKIKNLEIKIVFESTLYYHPTPQKIFKIPHFIPPPIKKLGRPWKRYHERKIKSSLGVEHHILFLFLIIFCTQSWPMIGKREIGFIPHDFKTNRYARNIEWQHVKHKTNVTTVMSGECFNAGIWRDKTIAYI